MEEINFEEAKRLAAKSETTTDGITAEAKKIQQRRKWSIRKVKRKKKLEHGFDIGADYCMTEEELLKFGQRTMFAKIEGEKTIRWTNKNKEVVILSVSDAIKILRKGTAILSKIYLDDPETTAIKELPKKKKPGLFARITGRS